MAAEVDLGAWMAQWGYTDADLFDLLKLQTLAALQRDQIAASVSESMWNRSKSGRSLLIRRMGAQRAKLELNSGADFEDDCLHL